MPCRLVYLHGFASSPASKKAQYFREKLAANGLSLEIPELDDGNYFRLMRDYMNTIDIE